MKMVGRRPRDGSSIYEGYNRRRGQSTTSPPLLDNIVLVKCGGYGKNDATAWTRMTIPRNCAGFLAFCSIYTHPKYRLDPKQHSRQVIVLP